MHAKEGNWSMMEPRDFYDAIEYWGGLWTFGSVANYAGLTASVNRMSEDQRDMFSEYLRTLPYARFLETRYWRAVRSHVAHTAKHVCAVCEQRVPGVEVHHRTYEHRGAEYRNLNDLRLLCPRCHNTVHEVGKLRIAAGKGMK